MDILILTRIIPTTIHTPIPTPITRITTVRHSGSDLGSVMGITDTGMGITVTAITITVPGITTVAARMRGPSMVRLEASWDTEADSLTRAEDSRMPVVDTWEEAVDNVKSCKTDIRG